MARKQKHAKQRSRSHSSLKTRQHQYPFWVLEAIAGGLLIIGYMLSLSSSHKKWAVAVFFAAWVLAGLGVAIKLWQEFSESPPKQLDNIKAPPLREETAKERAMVVPIAFDGEPKVDTPFTAFVRYKNRGKVIAKDVRVVFFAYGIKKGEKPDFNIIEKESPGGGSVSFLTPDQESTSYHTYNAGTPLTANEVAAVENGSVVIYAFGKIYYRDTPTCSHWTTFCTKYIPSLKQYSDYGEYNVTDEVVCP